MLTTQYKKVSVIIPTLNEEKHLSACLESITNVDYPAELLELVIIDNGSADTTLEIARRYTQNVFEQPFGTVAALRNFGAQQAAGDILAFVDGDCVVARDWLKNAARYFDMADVVAWGAPAAIPDNPTWVQKTWSYVRYRKAAVQEVEWLESMNLFIRTESFWQIDGFNEQLVTCEDVDLCYRLHELGKLISDRSIKVIHLGEAATIGQFIRKEIWRGHSNLKGLASHRFSMRELPSLTVPLYFGAVVTLGPTLLLVQSNGLWFYGLLLLYLLPTLLALIKVGRKKLSVRFLDLVRLSVLLQVYFFARTAALFKSGSR